MGKWALGRYFWKKTGALARLIIASNACLLPWNARVTNVTDKSYKFYLKRFDS
jgi:hypothetical protein